MKWYSIQLYNLFLVCILCKTLISLLSNSTIQREWKDEIRLWERKKTKKLFQTLGHLSVHFKSIWAVVSNNSQSEFKQKQVPSNGSEGLKLRSYQLIIKKTQQPWSIIQLNIRLLIYMQSWEGGKALWSTTHYATLPQPPLPRLSEKIMLSKSAMSCARHVEPESIEFLNLHGARTHIFTHGVSRLEWSPYFYLILFPPCCIFPSILRFMGVFIGDGCQYLWLLCDTLTDNRKWLLIGSVGKWVQVGRGSCII